MAIVAICKKQIFIATTNCYNNTSPYNWMTLGGIGAVIKVDSHLCEWGSIANKNCSFLIVSLSKSLSLCFMCSDQHVKYRMPHEFPSTSSLLLDYHVKQCIRTHYSLQQHYTTCYNHTDHYNYCIGSLLWIDYSVHLLQPTNILNFFVRRHLSYPNFQNHHNHLLITVISIYCN